MGKKEWTKKNEHANRILMRAAGAIAMTFAFDPFSVCLFTNHRSQHFSLVWTLSKKRLDYIIDTCKIITFFIEFVHILKNFLIKSSLSWCCLICLWCIWIHFLYCLLPNCLSFCVIRAKKRFHLMWFRSLHRIVFFSQRE